MAQQTAEKAAVITQYISNIIPDGLKKATPLCLHLTEAGKKFQNGGLYLQFPIKLLSNQSQGYISGTNALVDMTPSMLLQFGFLNWKYYNFNTNFTLEDYVFSGGATEQAEYMNSKIKFSIEDQIRDLSSSFHGSSSANALRVEGLLDIVAESGTSYAGLTDTDYATGTYLPVNTSTVGGTMVTMNEIIIMINKLRARNQQGSFNTSSYMALANDGLFSAISTVFNNITTAGLAKNLEIGFESFKVNGVEFYLDADCPGSNTTGSIDNYLYLLPKESMKLYYKYGFGKESPFDGEVRMPNQPIMSNQHYLAFNLVCDNRRLVGVNKTMAI